MFDLDVALRRWRKRQERTSSLSPRELDELEDHLKALVDLELELNAALAPTRAFAIARRELGEPAAISREFAKVGKPRWRRWLVAGWTMNVASWFLPAVRFKLFGVVHIMYGHELFLDPELLILVVPFNLWMLMTVPALWGARISSGRWLRRLLGFAGVFGLGAMVTALAYAVVTAGPGALPSFLYTAALWSGSASSICVAAALRLRAREWASAESKRVLAQ